MKIVILDGHAVNPGDLSWDCFRVFGDVTVYERTDPIQTIQRLQNAEIVMTNKTPITAEILAACPTIRLICVLATGFNVIDCGEVIEFSYTAIKRVVKHGNDVYLFTDKVKALIVDVTELSSEELENLRRILNSKFILNYFKWEY